MLVHSETKRNVSILCLLFTKYACSIFQLKNIEYIKMTDCFFMCVNLCVCLCVWQRSVATTTLCLSVYLMPLPTVWVCLRVCVVLICFSSSTTAEKKNMLLRICASISISVLLLLLFFCVQKANFTFWPSQAKPYSARPKPGLIYYFSMNAHVCQANRTKCSIASFVVLSFTSINSLICCCCCF